MIILGKTNDDKGAQLESLTRDILQEKGCKNIQVNFVGSGGEEIDVTADFPLPSIGNLMNRRLICECKAHSKPIDLPAWLKFLGMIFSEEARIRSEVSGFFIALSGVNGNVNGHYDELRRTRPNITLVAGDALFEEVRSIYALCDVEAVRSTLEKFTERQYRRLEVAYYDSKLYWIVIFQDDAYTILDSKGSLLENSSLAGLKTLVELVLPIRPLVALEDEAEAIRRDVQATKSALMQIMANGGQLNEENLQSGPPFDFTASELRLAVDKLVNRGWISKTGDTSELQLQENDEGLFYSTLTEIYHFLLNGEVSGLDLLKLMKSQFHAVHLNEPFVSQVRAIQGGLPLSPHDIQLVIKLLKWSPSALRRSLEPDEMIVKGRSIENSVSNIDQLHRNYFIQRLCNALVDDFGTPIVRSYLIDAFHIREIQTHQTFVVKSLVSSELEANLNERRGIAYLESGLTGPDGSDTIQMLLLKHAPEPWDVNAWNLGSSNPQTPGEQDENSVEATKLTPSVSDATDSAV